MRTFKQFLEAKQQRSKMPPKPADFRSNDPILNMRDKFGFDVQNHARFQMNPEGPRGAGEFYNQRMRPELLSDDSIMSKAMKLAIYIQSSNDKTKWGKNCRSNGIPANQRGSMIFNLEYSKNIHTGFSGHGLTPPEYQTLVKEKIFVEEKSPEYLKKIEANPKEIIFHIDCSMLNARTKNVLGQKDSMSTASQLYDKFAHLVTSPGQITTAGTNLDPFS